MKLISILLLAITCGCASAPKHDLPNPYAGVNFSVVNSPRTIRRLDSIMVPEVHFQEADIHDVIQWMVDFSSDFEKTHGKQGVTFFVPLGLTISDRPPPELSKITFTAANVSLLEIIKITATITGLDYVIYDKGLLQFRPKEGQPTAGGDGKPAPQP
jgi:hypothetical protein